VLDWVKLKNLPRWRGGSLPWWGCLCCVLCFNLYTNSYIEKPMGQKFFFPAQTLVVVKLLSTAVPLCIAGTKKKKKSKGKIKSN
jgi:hypothetical protein